MSRCHHLTREMIRYLPPTVRAARFAWIPLRPPFPSEALTTPGQQGKSALGPGPVGLTGCSWSGLWKKPKPHCWFHLRVIRHPDDGNYEKTLLQIKGLASLSFSTFLRPSSSQTKKQHACDENHEFVSRNTQVLTPPLRTCLNFGK